MSGSVNTDMGLDAVIVPGPGLIEICATWHLASHPLCSRKLSNQWRPSISGKNVAWTCVVLACEVSMEELAEIRKRTDLEIEASFYGAMCFLFRTLYPF